MAASAILSNSVLIITSATLFWVALTDFKEFKIRNELVLVLVGLFFLHSLVSGRWVELHWHLGLAAVMLAGMLYYYSQGLMGGGDVKLLGVAFLWTGPWCALIFAVLLMIFVGVHTIAAKLQWVEVLRGEKGNRIPLAPAIAAALIGTFVSGCLHPLP
jgi:prepilin peptidase CpaA